MTKLILSNNGKDKAITIPYEVGKVFNVIDKIMPSIETQLHTSIDVIVCENELTLLFDGVDRRIVAFVEMICQREIAKALA